MLFLLFPLCHFLHLSRQATFQVQNVSYATNLQLFNDVSVVFRGAKARLSPGRVLSRLLPVEERLLYHVIGLDEQVVHLTVEVHRDGDRSALGWERQTDAATLTSLTRRAAVSVAFSYSPTSESTLMHPSTECFWAGFSQLQWQTLNTPCSSCTNTG